MNASELSVGMLVRTRRYARVCKIMKLLQIGLGWSKQQCEVLVCDVATGEVFSVYSSSLIPVQE